MGTFEGEAESIPDLFIHWKEFYVSLELKKVLEMYTVDTTFRSVTLSNRSARYITFKLSSSCPYKEEYRETLSNIQQIPKLE